MQRQPVDDRGPSPLGAILIIVLLLAVWLGARQPRETVLWTVTAGDQIAAAPVLLGDCLAVASTDGHLYAVTPPTGAALWSVRPPERVEAGPVAAAGRLVVGLADGRLKAIEPAQGGDSWELAAGAPASHLAAAGDHLAAVCGGALLLVDAAGGRLAARIELAGEVTGLAADANGCVVTGTDGRVATWRWSGDRRWSTPAGQVPVRWPQPAEGAVYVTGDDGTVAKLDLLTARVVTTWRFVSPLAAAPVVAGERVLAATVDGRLIAANPDGYDWETRLPARAICAPVVAGRRVAVIGLDRTLRFVDAESGAEVGRLALGIDVTAQPVSDGERLYLGTWHGEIAAVAVP